MRRGEEQKCDLNAQMLARSASDALICVSNARRFITGLNPRRRRRAATALQEQRL